MSDSPQTPMLRPHVPALDARLGLHIPVLDHGFIRVVDYMGDDNAIVQAARVSYGTGTKSINEDRGLIRYLMRHWHSTPFEMCEIKFHIKLPIFVARQWIRHRMANVNEYSARYSVLDKEFYMPHPKDLAAQSSSNHQGRAGVLDPKEAEHVLALLKRDAEQSYASYLELMNQTPEGETLDKDRQGLARELARANLNVGFYTQWYWKTDLHNFMNFLRLRADHHAQYEIRVYAEALLDVLETWVPHAAEAFKDYRLGAVSFSAQMLDVVRKRLAGEDVSMATSGLSGREWKELESLLQPK